jgi:DNA-binding CsgD family transcriptional regulator
MRSSSNDLAIRIREFRSPRPERHAASGRRRSMSGLAVASLPLLGREREREALDRLLESARDGHGGTMVVHGEPGVGKTALLNRTIEQATRFRVIRAAGVEGEMEFPFAALQQLCAPIFALAERLPEPQRDSLSVAFGLRAGSAPNPFHVGLAVLGLVSEAAVAEPLLIVVDDTQWLDQASAQALAFAARRVASDRAAVVLVAREPGEAFAGLPELRVGPLGRRDARTLLTSVLSAPLDDAVLERVVVETRGNPLALLELPRGLTPAQLAGGFGLPEAVPLHDHIEEAFTRRLAPLPPDARLLMLIAAVDPTGDVGLVWRAAERLQIARSAAVAAQAEGLVTFGVDVTFRHPLVRSAVYRAAGAAERRDVHRALADVTDPETDPDRRAWHRARAAVTPDEEVAGDLERSATRAHARGGFAAAAAFLEQSAALTLDPMRRSARMLAAAAANERAGALDHALKLLDDADTGVLNEFQRAEAEVLRARIAFSTHRGREAPALLVAAASRLEPIDVALARETHLDALTAAVFAGRLAGELDAHRVAVRALAAPPSLPQPRAVDLLLDGLALLITQGPELGTSRVRDALRAFRDGEMRSPQRLRWLWLCGRTAGFVWDYESWDSLTLQQIQTARQAGALGDLPLALSTRVGVQIFAGRLEAAAALVEESSALADVTDERIVPPYGALALAAFRGREAETTGLVRASIEAFTARGEGMGITVAHWVSAVLANGLGRYDVAFDAAVRATVNPRELWFSTFATVELIEAATRSGHPEQAADAFAVLRASTSASGTPWALGVAARSSALLRAGSEAETLYREAIERLTPTRLQLDLARAHLLYGEWLRREGRRVDARNQLRSAHELLSGFGMEAFAERARVELEATGERARRRSIEATDQLTPQEAEIARLAALGTTNRDIATRLFISPSTVEYHLRKVFRKLEVTSRTQLARRLR